MLYKLYCILRQNEYILLFIIGLNNSKHETYIIITVWRIVLFIKLIMSCIFSCKNISFMIYGETNIHFTISLNISRQWNYNCYVVVSSIYSDSNMNLLYTVKKIVNLRPRRSQIIIIIIALKMLPRWISDFIANDSFDAIFIV